MGKIMETANNLIFVSFKMIDDDYVAAVPLDSIQTGAISKESELKAVTKIYKKQIVVLKKILKDIESDKSKRIALTAVKMWILGDKILELIEMIGRKNFQIDNLYEHLTRDLDRKKDWLKKAIIFRKYLPDGQLIPPGLKWHHCKDMPKISAEMILRNELPVTSKKI
jgi:hypothetical protein